MVGYAAEETEPIATDSFIEWKSEMLVVSEMLRLSATPAKTAGLEFWCLL
jgi:hypothetical protein